MFWKIAEEFSNFQIHEKCSNSHTRLAAVESGLNNYYNMEYRHVTCQLTVEINIYRANQT